MPRCLTERDLQGAEIWRGPAGPRKLVLSRILGREAADPRGLESLSRRWIEACSAALEGKHNQAVDALEIVHAESEQSMRSSSRCGLRSTRTLTDLDRARAADILRTTSERAELLGAIALSELAEQRLRALGVRTWKRRSAAPARSGLDALSDREREIARLAASGANNLEIAQAVFLSRKTVERHLSNIFAKLGVRNRTELANQLSSRSEQAGQSQKS